MWFICPDCKFQDTEKKFKPSEKGIWDWNCCIECGKCYGSEKDAKVCNECGEYGRGKYCCWDCADIDSCKICDESTYHPKLKHKETCSYCRFVCPECETESHKDHFIENGIKKRERHIKEDIIFQHTQKFEKKLEKKLEKIDLINYKGDSYNKYI